jgi:hypothetical protein
MDKINWLPEENGLAGGFEAAGFLRLLGVPSLHNVELLVRETAQNSWDARANKAIVEMQFIGKQFDKGSTEHTALVEKFFSHKPKKNQFPSLSGSLEKSSIPILVIRDSETKGLGGVTNARSVGQENATNRYRRFLLNIGEQGYKEHGGGAYGYGRSICFSASFSHTAIIYSRTKDDLKDYESRLIGVGYGNQFALNDTNHNGRHWWTTSDTIGSPITGEMADSIAEELGLQPYKRKESGTTIMIIDPDLGTDLADAMRSIALSIETHLWPKYVDLSSSGRPPQMKFAVTHLGKDVQIRKPSDIDPLKHYVRAFSSSIKRNSERATHVDLHDPGLKHTAIFLRPDQRSNPIGQLSVSSFPKNSEPLIDPDTSETSYMQSKLSSLNSHVVLLRDPDLVITYEAIKPNDDSTIGTAGVFKADPSSNENLRKSEPPAHDSWSEGHQNPEVNKTTRAVHRNIKRFIESQVNPNTEIRPTESTADNSHASVISKHIGSLIWNEVMIGGGNLTPGGGGGAGGAGGGGGGGGAKNPKIEKPKLALTDGQPSLIWKIKFPSDRNAKSVKWQIELQLASGDGNKFESIETELEIPKFVKNSDKNLVLKNKHSLEFTHKGTEETIEVCAIVDKGTMVTIDIQKVGNKS